MEFVLGLALSLHVGFDDSYNNIHPKFSASYENLIMGGYYNSIKKPSFYFGRSSDLTENLTLETVIVSGYVYGPIIPAARLLYKDKYYLTYGQEGKGGGIVIGIDIPLGSTNTR